MSTLSWTGYGPASPVQQEQPTVDSRLKRAQSRQLLSCTKCRERKVKCDRTKPCSACCARGHPKECEFIVGEGNDYSPIQQSYEIRQLRSENQRLKERLRALRQHSSDDDNDGDVVAVRKTTKGGQRPSSIRQRGFKIEERIDNLYFGTPGLSSIVSEFANLQVGSQSLVHAVPKGRDFYAADSPAYPFPAIPDHSTNAALLHLLPPRGEIFQYLDLFQRRAQSCSFPHIPEEVTEREVERFLSDAEHNADKSPDMLALIFATIATGLQMGQHDQNGGQWSLAVSESVRQRGDAFLAASMQSLRNASFMNTPTLLGIQTLIMIGPYLTNSGRFLDAWTLFGTTVRLAHSIGLHRNPKLLDPVPPLPQYSLRQTLWWWMLHMDQQYSVTLGRPLGISGFGDCPPPQQLTTNPTMLRLSEFINHFTIISRQILGSDGMMSVAKIDEFTDKLLGLWDTMPNALVFHERWVDAQTALPEWPLEVMSTTLFVKMQSLLILLNRQRIERTTSRTNSPPLSATTSHRPRSAHLPPSPGSTDIKLHMAPVRGRALVINCSVQIVKAFLFFKHRNPAVLICWTLGQQAFNACMILLLDAWETEDEQYEWLLSEAYAVFRELEINGVHKLAELAVARISEGLYKIGQRQEEREAQEAEMLMRSASGHHPHHPQQQHDISPSMSFDTSSSMLDWTPTDTVMGNTGMFLLEDPGLQAYAPQAFEPLGWNMVGSRPVTGLSYSTDYSNNGNVVIKQQPRDHYHSPHLPPSIPVSQVIPAPFPTTVAPIPMTSTTVASPFALGLQTRMTPARRPTSRRRASHQHHQNHHEQQQQQQQGAFTPINMTEPMRSHTFPQPVVTPPREARGYDMHRLDKPPRSQQRQW